MNEPGHMLKCLRLIHAAYDANGEDLSAWPAEAAEEIERLADALMERERDARRYRWLRDSRDSGAMLRLLYEDGQATPEFCDEAIDTAMLKTPNAE